MKFKNYEEIEKIMVKEEIENFADFVRRELEREIEKKWHDFMEYAKYKYIVVEHPHRMPAKIYVISGYKDGQNMIYDGYGCCLEDIYDYLKVLTITDAIEQCFDLMDLHSFEIYEIEELKVECPTLKEAVDRIYNEQSYHNRLRKDEIEKEIACYWTF